MLLVASCNCWQSSWVGLEGVEGLLDAYIAMIPKFDGDAAPLGQRPLSVLPVMCRIWASARMVQLEDWFRSWVPDSVKKVLVVVAGRLRLGTPLLWMLRRCFLVLLTLMFISSWLMLSSPLTLLIEASWIGSCAVLAYLAGSVMLILSIMLM